MESYRKFQKETNAKPENILFFDDSINNCINALNSGWNVILVNTNKPINVVPIKSKINILTTICKNKFIYQIDSISDIVNLLIF
jgi:FMN phosphatase YigB (HAD superfamily)